MTHISDNMLQPAELEENWQDGQKTNHLGWSEELTYTFDESRAQDDKVTGIWIGGEPVLDTAIGLGPEATSMRLAVHGHLLPNGPTEMRLELQDPDGLRLVGVNGNDLEVALGATEDALTAEQTTLDVVFLGSRVTDLAHLLPLAVVPVQERHLVEREHGVPPTKVSAYRRRVCRIGQTPDRSVSASSPPRGVVVGVAPVDHLTAQGGPQRPDQLRLRCPGGVDALADGHGSWLLPHRPGAGDLHSLGRWSCTSLARTLHGGAARA